MKPTRLLAICGAIALTSLPLQAVAQGKARDADFAVEGPIFDLPAGMNVDRQEVRISPYSVRLIYVFRASARRTIYFRFALPDMPVDASPDAIGLDGKSDVTGLAADRRPLNYLNLSVHVNNAPLALSGRGRALYDGKDVTRQLLKAEVPLLYDLSGEPPWRRLPPNTQAMLETNGLLSIDAAQWSYQADFEWKQQFEPGETRVEISYTPVMDYWSDINSAKFPEIAPEGTATQAYCIDDALRQAYFHNPMYELYTVMHSAPPSRGWRGPVGHYRLSVDKGSTTNMVAFCPLAARKTSPTTFEWTATNFTPHREIGVLFFVAP